MSLFEVLKPYSEDIDAKNDKRSNYWTLILKAYYIKTIQQVKDK